MGSDDFVDVEVDPGEIRTLIADMMDVQARIASHDQVIANLGAGIVDPIAPLRESLWRGVSTTHTEPRLRQSGQVHIRNYGDEAIIHVDYGADFYVTPGTAGNIIVAAGRSVGGEDPGVIELAETSDITIGSSTDGTRYVVLTTSVDPSTGVISVATPAVENTWPVQPSDGSRKDILAALTVVSDEVIYIDQRRHGPIPVPVRRYWDAASSSLKYSASLTQDDEEDPTPSLYLAVKRITHTDSAYTALATDGVILGDTDGGAITINLPAGVKGKLYTIKNVGSSGNDITVDGNASETIDGDLTAIVTDREGIQCVFETTEHWVII